MKPKPFDAERFRALSRGKLLGQPLDYRPVTGSTNDDALAAARSGAEHGSLFVADEQSAGRGRRGHTWLAAAGETLLFSLLLRPKLDLTQVSGLTLAIGLALRAAVTPYFAHEAQVKWPNDLLVNGQKLAGVLLESQVQGSHLQVVVVGVGLNVSTREFPEPITGRATSLALLGATHLEREPLLRAVLDEITLGLEAYQRTGVSGVLRELNRADALRGKRLRVDGLRGIGCGFDEQGCLVLEDDTGRRHAICSGTVELT
jgi:BirA family biotin operon repressor/biotin-[acetyl-CoA-carboxylase] ligase